MDDEATLRGMYDFWWTHNLIPYEIHQGITSNCNFSSTAHKSALCLKYLDKAEASRGDIYLFDINTPSCKNSSRPVLSVSTIHLYPLSHLQTHPTQEHAYTILSGTTKMMVGQHGLHLVTWDLILCSISTAV